MRQWSWEATDYHGYRTEEEFAIGTPSTLVTAYLLPGFTSRNDISSVCPGFDPTTDGVLPVVVHMTNTTPSFAESTQFNATLNPNGWASATSPRWNIVVDYSNGVTCTAFDNDAVWGNTCNNLQPQTDCTIAAYFVLPQYFSPNLPQGNPGFLDKFMLRVWPGQIDGSTWRVGDPTGPGLSPLSDGSVYVPLGGSMK